MKKSTKLYLLAAIPVIGWAAWSDFTHHDERELELVIKDAGKEATCVRTEQLNGHDWMTCRWGQGDADYGPVWLKVGTAEDGKPIWTPANGKASQVLDRYLMAATQERQMKLAHVIRRNPGSDLPRVVPWERLD